MGNSTINSNRPWITYGLLILGVGVFLGAPLELASDGSVRFDALDHLLRTGRFQPCAYSSIGPLFATPLWWIGLQIDRTHDAVCAFNRIVFLAMVLGLWKLLSTRLEMRELHRFLLLLLFGSMFPWHVTGFFGEVFHVGCVGFGLAALVRGGWWAWLGWPAAVIGTGNLPGTAPGLALAAVVLCWNKRCLRYLLLPVAAGGLILLENWFRRGSIDNDGYGQNHGDQSVLPFSGLPTFSYPLFFGLLSTLFSFGKGLIFYTPGIFFPYPADDAEDDRELEIRVVYRVWMAMVIGLVLIYSRWWAWYGGFVWGPRFHLFACLPASLVLARMTIGAERRSLATNVMVLAALLLSCWSSVSGLVWGLSGAFDIFNGNPSLEPLTWYVPECSDLWRPFVYWKPLGDYDVLRLACFSIGFLYLSLPVLLVVACRLGSGFAAFCRSARNGPRWTI